MAIVYLGVGSNLGDRNHHITKALSLLKASHIDILQCSTVIETEPQGGPPQGRFLNAVLKIKTPLDPFSLLHLLQEIENKLCRQRGVVNGPRTIDLDILLYDDIKIETPQLTIPHPRMFKRDFVMRPLKELSPNLSFIKID